MIALLVTGAGPTSAKCADINTFRGINVERTFDVGLLLDILTNKDIFDSISEDGATVEDLDFDVIKNIWVSISANGKNIGVAQFRQVFNKTYDCHIHILPEDRKKYSIKAGKSLVEWCDENLKDSLLYTNVPVFCESVRNFLLKNGFNDTGFLEKAWLKNGVRNDMWVLTRGTSCQ